MTFDQKSCPGAGFAHINCPRGPGFDRGWEVAKIQHTGLIPTQNRFFGIHIYMKQNFLFNFQNSEVCSNVL